MAITWGKTVRNSGGNTLQVGIDMSQSPSRVSAGTSSVKVTAKIYVRTIGPVYYNGARLSLAGSFSGNTMFNVRHGSGGGTTLVRTVTRTVKPSYSGSTTSKITASVSGLFNFGVAKHSRSVSTGRRPYSKPATPTGATVSRSSDTRQIIRWSNKATTGAPYASIHIERSTNNGAWAQIATVKGGATSYTDTGTRNNAFYRYRVHARNSGGYSGYATTSYVTTTPAKPPAPKATKRGATIVVDTGTNLPRATNRIEIFDSVDGAKPVRVGAVSARTGVNTRWTHQNPDTTKTHAYTVRARGGAPEDAAGYIWGPQSNRSNTVQLLTAPAAPKLKESAAALIPYGEQDTVRLGWSHESIDSTEQNAYEVRLDYGDGDGYESLGKQESGADSHELYIIFAFPPTTIRWQVRTWGEHADPSPWSPVGVIDIKNAPAVAIIDPADGSEINTSNVSVAVEFETDETTEPQRWEAYLAELGNSENQLWNGTGRADTVIELPEIETPDQYALAVRVRDTAGMWSPWAESWFTIRFLPPPAPVVDSVDWDIAAGAVHLSITAAEPGAGEDVTESFDVYRVEETPAGSVRVPVLLNVTPEEAGLISDPVPPLNTAVMYEVRARTGYGATASTTETVETAARGWCYVNGGAGFNEVARIRDNLSTDYTRGVVKQLHQFAGRRYPVEYQGNARTLKIGMAGRLGGGSSTLEEWWNVVEATPPLCFRDATLKAFVAAGEVSTSYTRVTREISVDFEGVDYDESTGYRGGVGGSAV